MVGQGEQPTEKTAEEIVREAEEEIARVAQLAQEVAEKKTQRSVR
jgi:isocitrate/isopropylmalate dehydrogenase